MILRILIFQYCVEEKILKRYYRDGEILRAFLGLGKSESSYENINYCIEKFINKFANDEDKITFLFDFISILNQDLRSSINGIEFLEHKQKIERQISSIERDIKRGKKRDFMEDY